MPSDGAGLQYGSTGDGALHCEHAAAFDEEFFFALRHEYQAAQTTKLNEGEDTSRLLRRGQLIGQLITTRGGPGDVRSARLRVECALEALLHASLTNWSLYRRSAVICASIPAMDAR